MGGSRALTTVLAAGLGLAAALGAPAQTAQPQAQPQAQAPAAKVAPVEYLKAGASLFNKGEDAKAAKYFDAAERFRSQLTENEQIVLDVYQEEVEKKRAQRQSAPRPDPAVAPASMSARAPATAATGPAARPRAPAPSRYQTTDPKQRARWLIQEAREQIQRGNYDGAARKLAEAESLNATWGRLEDSPAKLAKVLEKARARAPQASSTPPTVRPLGVHVPGPRPARP